MAFKWDGGPVPSCCSSLVIKSYFQTASFGFGYPSTCVLQRKDTSSQATLSVTNFEVQPKFCFALAVSCDHFSTLAALGRKFRAGLWSGQNLDVTSSIIGVQSVQRLAACRDSGFALVNKDATIARKDLVSTTKSDLLEQNVVRIALDGKKCGKNSIRCL